MAAAGDAVWVGDGEVPEVARVSADGASRSRVIKLGLGGDVDFIAAGEGAVWAVMTQVGRVWRIDPDSNEKTPIDVPYEPWGVAVGTDAVWVTVEGSSAPP
jgi:hypothetical protein